MAPVAPVVLAHPADNPYVLGGGALFLLVVFALLELSARRRERDEDDAA